MPPRLTSIAFPMPQRMSAPGTRQHEDRMEVEEPISPRSAGTEEDITEQEDGELAEAIDRYLQGVDSYETRAQWESELLSVEASEEIREVPDNCEYDGQLLLIMENWIKMLTRLSALENADDPGDPWPFALTRLNYLIRRCHGFIFEYYAACCESGEFDDPQPETFVAPRTQNEVWMARLTISHLLLTKFGWWLARLNEHKFLGFRAGLPFYNVDYDKMYVEFVSYEYKHKKSSHTRSYLGIGMLFPDERPGELSVDTMQHMNRKPFPVLGIECDYYDIYPPDAVHHGDDSYMENNSNIDDNGNSSKSNIATHEDNSCDGDSDITRFHLNNMQGSDASDITLEELYPQQYAQQYPLDESGGPGMIEPGATKPSESLDIESTNLRFAELESKMSRLEDQVATLTEWIRQMAIISDDAVRKIPRSGD